MVRTRAMKLLGLISGIVLLNIITWSPGLLAVEIGGKSAFQTALGVTIVFSSFLVLMYGSYTMLLKPPIVTPIKDITSSTDYRAALNRYKNEKDLNSDILLALDQLDRIEKKNAILLDILNQRFDPSELSYKKFIAVIHDVENLFYFNIRKMLNKLSVFDASEYSNLTSSLRFKQISNNLLQKKQELYMEYLAFVTAQVSANEQILLKLEQLLMEISQLGSANDEDVDHLPCMQEIDALIKQTKFYQQ
ncbi:MAG: hypothetical protein P0Y55_07685 [Candidatus Cohnella colombiensis]|uniref:5-bromo-4-chloroindolyl phosphate hydrolysis protein n=1 Tax=Candidatus Cohnella colombiensis TaxID=3121368 RepID=A0AA95F1F9_9BACL|nr:MAG: hypothetical protein P0Y55_07685 [Cohnella sp.]